jgi:hypothetical protein
MSLPLRSGAVSNNPTRSLRRNTGCTGRVTSAPAAASSAPVTSRPANPVKTSAECANSAAS